MLQKHPSEQGPYLRDFNPLPKFQQNYGRYTLLESFEQVPFLIRDGNLIHTLKLSYRSAFSLRSNSRLVKSSTLLL